MRPLALVLAFALSLATPVRADPPSCDVPSATGRSVRLRLLGPGEREGVPSKPIDGYFYPDEQVKVIARRIVDCEAQREKLIDDLAKCEVDRNVATVKAGFGWKFWSAVVGAALAAGFAAGKAAR